MEQLKVALTTHELWPQRTNVALNASLACINFGLQAALLSSFHRIPEIGLGPDEISAKRRLDQCTKAANCYELIRIDPPTSQNINMLMRGSGYAADGGWTVASQWREGTKRTDDSDSNTATATVYGDLWVHQMLYGVSLWLIYLARRRSSRVGPQIYC